MPVPSYLFAYAIALLLSLSPLKVASQSCKADCTVSVFDGNRILWVPKRFSTTIVAAIVFQIIDTDLDTTRLSTEYKDIPAGYTVPTNTNAQGTQTVVAGYRRSGQIVKTVLAFPTTLNQFPDEYLWKGTLPTTDAVGNSVCSTASDRATGLVDYFSQGSSFTTPTHTYGPDPGGLLFTTSQTAAFTSMAQTYKALFPNEGALQTCSIVPPPAPAVVELTARFITDTVVSYVGGTPASNSGTVQETVPPSDPQTVTSPAPNPMTRTYTSASPRTIVSEGPSGPQTIVETVEIISVTVSTAEGATSIGTVTTAGATASTNNAPGMGSIMTFWASLAGGVTLMFMHSWN